MRIHDITRASGHAGTGGTEPYNGLTEGCIFRLNYAFAYNYSGGPEPNPEATKKDFRKDWEKWESVICDDSFLESMKIQHRHLFDEELNETYLLESPFELAPGEIDDINQKASVRYKRSASDETCSKLIGGWPDVFKKKPTVPVASSSRLIVGSPKSVSFRFDTKGGEIDLSPDEGGPCV